MREKLEKRAAWLLTFASAFYFLSDNGADNDLWFHVLVGRRIRPLSRAYIDAWSAKIGIAEENLGMLPVINSFTRERHESSRFAPHERGRRERSKAT